MAETETDLTPAVHNLHFYRGDSVDLPLRFGTANENGEFDTAINLTGYVFASQIRAKEDSTDVLASFVVTLADQTQPATVGGLRLSLAAGVTSPFPSSARWDLQATMPGGVVRTRVAGKVTTDKDTTRV